MNPHVEDSNLGAGVLARILNAPQTNEIAVGNGDEFLFRLVVSAEYFGIEGDSLDVAFGPRRREDETPSGRFHGFEAANDAGIRHRDPIMMTLKDVDLRRIRQRARQADAESQIGFYLTVLGRRIAGMTTSEGRGGRGRRMRR